MYYSSINSYISELGYISYGTGNHIKRLANCTIGFRRNSIGGQNGRFYVVTNPNNYDVVNPWLGTLRHAIIQTNPLWIIFERDMVIPLKEELIMNNYKTINGRGTNFHISNGPCIVVQYVSQRMLNGAYSFLSGMGASSIYAKTSSLSARPSSLVTSLTGNIKFLTCRKRSAC